MKTIRLTQKDNHQLLELPEEYQMQGQEVYIKKIGNIIVLIPKDKHFSNIL